MSSYRGRPAKNYKYKRLGQSMDYRVDVGRNPEERKVGLAGEFLRIWRRPRCNGMFVLDTSWKFIQLIVYIPLKILGFPCVYFMRFIFFLYWRATGQLPSVLAYYGIRGENIAHINNGNQEQEEIIRAKHEIRHLHDAIDDKDLQVEKLKQANAALEAEKHDALRRLSEIASAKLRDNNPNIADLNDQCRPTKLAEMFSELYDNEWTSAYSKLEGDFGEQRATEILLQIVMEAYGFCENKVAGSWDELMKWFIDMSFPGAQQTLKWLKDSRKAKIRGKVKILGAEYEKELKQMVQEDKLVELLSMSEMREYITKTVELCLLMVTTDPPVVLSCPGWSSNQRKREAVGNQPIDHEEDNKTDVNSKDKGKTYFGRSKIEMEPFNKDLFKEYTKSGPFIDFPVWPVLFLHKNGPLLSKGIAQGKKPVTTK